jgi:hypothetical protein
MFGIKKKSKHAFKLLPKICFIHFRIKKNQISTFRNFYQTDSLLFGTTFLELKVLFKLSNAISNMF